MYSTQTLETLHLLLAVVRPEVALDFATRTAKSHPRTPFAIEMMQVACAIIEIGDAMRGFGDALYHHTHDLIECYCNACDSPMGLMPANDTTEHACSSRCERFLEERAAEPAGCVCCGRTAYDQPGCRMCLSDEELSA